MSLLEVQFQPQAQRILRHSIASGRIPHAYIFHGPDGVGKELFALGLAEISLCAKPIDHRFTGAQLESIGADAVRTGCGRCDDCRMLAAGTHPDFHLITRQLHREHPDPEVRKRRGLEITVDVLRHFVMDRVALTPKCGRAKIFVIREAEEMTVQAQNALLKTLEEPPQNTMIILLTRSVDRLLATTQSRCQLVPFGTLPIGFVKERLRALRPDAVSKVVEWCATASDGSLGRAILLFDLELHAAFGRIHVSLDHLSDSRDEAVVKQWTEEAKALGERLRADDPEMTDAESTRRGLSEVLQLAARSYDESLRDFSGQGSDSDEAEMAAAAIDRLAEAEHQLDLNANTQLVMEVLIGELKALGERPLERAVGGGLQ
ncbi:MAG: DNA polymerase III subunit [Planctomycetes bacterium]|nr:DNA polymerase III subunit [Planctomycetota bacterium]